jgi:hypothetical protein
MSPTHAQIIAAPKMAVVDSMCFFAKCVAHIHSFLKFRLKAAKITEFNFACYHDAASLTAEKSENTNNSDRTQPCLALLPPQQSHLDRHRAWGFTPVQIR